MAKHQSLCLCATIATTLSGQMLFAAERDITVAADGIADFKTLPEAIASVRDRSVDRTTIHLAPGIYAGPLIIPQAKTHVAIVGHDAAKTILTWDKNMLDPQVPGLPRSNPGVLVLADDFRVENVTIRNTSGDHGQGLALRVDADRSLFKNCRFLGWQDTLMLNKGRQYLQNCYVEGRVDFIYGDGTAVFDHCEVHSKNGGMVTAANTPADHPYGFVFLNCQLTGDPNAWSDPAAASASPPATTVPKAHLGRPWRPYADVIYIHCEMGDHIAPEGWDNWRDPTREKTARFAEFENYGPGATPDRRVAWSRQLTKEEADKITVENVLAGSDHWNPR